MYAIRVIDDTEYHTLKTSFIAKRINISLKKIILYSWMWLYYLYQFIT